LQLDTFFLSSGNVGDISHIQIRAAGGGLNAAWHLTSVTVTPSATSQRLLFPFNGWIDAKHGLQHVLHQDRDGDGKGDEREAGAMVPYRVTVHTSDIR
jgi:hypothetical protein